MNIALIGSQHGNELLGEKLYNYLKAHHPELAKHVTFFLANPAAHREGMRFIESDMNRSYVDSPRTYEERLASKLLSKLASSSYDVILDLHTTTVDQPPSFICGNHNQKVEKFITGSHIVHVVTMSPDIAAHSLIGTHPAAVAIEVNEVIDDTLLANLCRDIDHFVQDRRIKQAHRYYQVLDFIHKNEYTPKVLSTFRNLQPTAYGFSPFLYGENSYKQTTNYLGFKVTSTPEADGSTL